ncbi:MAG: peroxiredoxin family protein [Bacteriovoracaceae bacterium]|nr:peroxiredoxin family protein [Bacteriovoracaceae bacterium]
MNKLKGLVLAVHDPSVNELLPLIPEGTIVKNFELLLSNGRRVELNHILKNGPLLLVFIRGTWCPYCRMHLSRLREWMRNLQNKKSTVIVVSTETPEIINEWLTKNNSSYLFASDAKMELSDYFGVHINPNDFANAATFLIDTDNSLKLSYAGKRTDKNFEEMDKKLTKTK